MWKIKLQKIVADLLDERYGHKEIFSRPQIIENSRQYLLLRTDILQKIVVECPWKNQCVKYISFLKPRLDEKSSIKAQCVSFFKALMGRNERDK